MARRSKPIKLYEMAGDHGPDTPAQRENSEILPMTGDNPNKVGIKRVKNVLKHMHMSSRLTIRQYQAGTEIQDAYAATEALSSGSPLKEQVDSTQRPDASIAAQVDAMSRLARAMRPIPQQARAVIEAVCWFNLPVDAIAKGSNHRIATNKLQVTLDKVANEMGY